MLETGTAVPDIELYGNCCSRCTVIHQITLDFSEALRYIENG